VHCVSIYCQCALTQCTLHTPHSSYYAAVCTVHCVRDSSSVQCTDVGWNSVNGDVISKCVREYGCAELALRFLLSGDEN
jgi:hypothetical protein